MITKSQAKNIAKHNLPDGSIKKCVRYKDWWLLMIFTTDKYEGVFDPFYCIDVNSGEFSSFPYMNKQYFDSVMNLFSKM